MFHMRDKELSKLITRNLKNMNLNIQVMHVCGTHQDTIVKFGLDSIFNECGVKIIQGPGCPVCVTTPEEIETGIKLAENGVTIATFGDMVRVPGAKKSLQAVKAGGGDIRIVYGINEAVELAEKFDREGNGKEVVFMAVGFETTAPATAAVLLRELPENFSVVSCHRYIPPALVRILGMGEIALDGIIDPGHVSVIIGAKAYEEISRQYGIPQVIAGFEPIDVMMAVWMIAKQVAEGRGEVENEYTRCVAYEGNEKALKMLDEVFEPGDAKWRGFPVIERSKMVLRKKFDDFNAEKKFEDILAEMEGMEFKEPLGCRCGEVLRGLIPPTECPLFGKACNPAHPVGPCMVSVEGACNIEYRYKND